MWHCKFSGSIAASHPILPGSLRAPSHSNCAGSAAWAMGDAWQSLGEPFEQLQCWKHAALLTVHPQGEALIARHLPITSSHAGHRKSPQFPLALSIPRHLNYGSLSAPQEAKRLQQPLEKLIFWTHAPLFSFLPSEKQWAKTRCSPDVVAVGMCPEQGLIGLLSL